MIEIRLKNIADRLGKSITDIARETGLNRNTVTDIYHGEVDGIKFSTIDALCDTYGLNLHDLIARKEFKIGGVPKSRIIKDIRSESPYFSWLFLDALHKPSEQYFDIGAGNIYAFFVGDRSEWYFDRVQVNRCAQRIYENFSEKNIGEVNASFIRARDQLMAYVSALADQPLEQYIGNDLIKTGRRLSELAADMLAVSAWIDAFDFGVRDDIVAQAQKAHGFTPMETSILMASGENSRSIIRRLDVLDLAEKCTKSNKKPEDFVIENREAKRFLHEYPFVSLADLASSITAYVSNTAWLANEKELLSHLSRKHAEEMRHVLRKHKIRLNPLAFFAKLAAWREERDEIEQYFRFQMRRILDVAAVRFHINPSFAPFLLPQELMHAQSGLIADHVLRHRGEDGFLLSLEHGTCNASEGERAISIQDDLASRYLSQLEL